MSSRQFRSPRGLLIWGGGVYSKEVLTYFDEAFVPKTMNPPNIAQGRPIEDFWGVLVQLIYEHNLEAKTTKQLERRIRKILKNIDITLSQNMMENVRNLSKNVYRRCIFHLSLNAF